MRDDDKSKEPKRRRPASTGADRLRNLYRSGDESGETPPDKGETFSGLLPKKRSNDQ